MKNFIFAAKNMQDYQYLKEKRVKHIIVGGKNFSRLGELSDEELVTLAKDAVASGIELQVDFDLLPTHHQWQQLTQDFAQLPLPPTVQLRILDTGLMQWVFEKTAFRFNPLLEAGFHNSEAIKRVHQAWGTRISSWILSKELVWQRQLDYAESFLGQTLELAFLAPILLFYSPRKLLAPHVKTKEQDFTQVQAASQESVHRGFLVRENQHGTLFFHPKYQCLATRLEKFEEHTTFRLMIDLRLVSDDKLRLQLMEICLQGTHNAEELAQKIETLLPFETTRGFFEVNKTDVLFSKLKNQHRSHGQHSYVGEVMDMIKGQSLVVALSTGQKICAGDQLYLQSPQGHTATVTLSQLSDLWDRKLANAGANFEVIKMNYLKHFPAKSAVFKVEYSV